MPPDRRERAENRGELIEIIAGRGPARIIATHWHKDEAETSHGIGRGFDQWRRGWHHSFQQGQRQRRSDTAQESAAGDKLFCKNHNAFLMLNGVLLTMPMTIVEK